MSPQSPPPSLRPSLKFSPHDRSEPPSAASATFTLPSAMARPESQATNYTNYTYATSASGSQGTISAPPSATFPNSALASPRGSISTLHVGGSGGIGFPRTHTGDSTTLGTEGKYRRKVGFEAFNDDQPDTLFTFTCQAKSEGYKRSKNTRVVLVAVSPDESGEDALDWLMSEMVEDGDEIVAMRVKEMSDEERHSEEAHEELREEAMGMLRTVLHKNNEEDGRKISVIVELVVGRVQDMILKIIALYRPDSLVVGTKGQRSRLQNWGKAFGAPGMGSISRFAVMHAPVPVIVVRPERKVKKTIKRREAAGKRGQYAALVGHDDQVLSRSRSRERSRDRRSEGGRSDGGRSE